MSDLPAQLRAALRGRGTPDALTWIVPAIAAAAAPHEWSAAFSGLDNENQHQLLGMLRGPEAGVGGAVLMALLAQRIADLTDIQIQAFVAEDAVHAHERLEQTLQALRDRVQSLEGELAHGRARLEPGFDLEGEAQRLQRQLAELRAKELDVDERFAQVHGLESEILRFETRKRILKRYDEAERRAYIETLRQEVEAAEAEKRRMESSVSAAIGDRDTAVREAARMTELRRVAEEEASQAAVTRAEAQTAVQRAQERLQAANTGRREEELQLITIQAEAERLERDRAESADRLRRERLRLEELESAAKRTGNQELAERTRALYESLPPDRADEGFSANRRTP